MNNFYTIYYFFKFMQKKYQSLKLNIINYKMSVFYLFYLKSIFILKIF